MKLKKPVYSSTADVGDRIKTLLDRKGSQNTIRRVQGNLESRFIIISPIPDAECERANLPWTNSAARGFFEILLTHSPSSFGHNSHFLVVPPVFYAVKKFKPNSEGRALGIIQMLADLKPRVFLCAGPGPFGMMFRGGAIPDADCACSNILYSPLVPNSKIMVFPDATPLGFSQDKDDYDNFRAYAIAQSRIRQTLLHYAEVLPRYKALLK